MKDQAKIPLMIVAVIVLAGLLFFFGRKASSVGDLDQGQLKYTPGKPPWDDPLRKGQAGSTEGQGSTPSGMGPPTRG